jgi:hypothetical protein
MGIFSNILLKKDCYILNVANSKFDMSVSEKNLVLFSCQLLVFLSGCMIYA